jgi:hypothetical protein
MKTADVYPDAGYDSTYFMAFDPEATFPHFHEISGDETIGNVHRVTGGPEDGRWMWSMTVSLPGPGYSSARSGTVTSRREAGRSLIAAYRHYLSARPNAEQYKKKGPLARP